MSGVNTFTIVGSFDDKITLHLERIEQLSENITKVQRTIARATGRVIGQYQETEVITQQQERVRQRTQDDLDRMIKAMLDAHLTAQNFQRAVGVLNKAIGKSISQIQGQMTRAWGFLKKAFGEAMEDQISDIQAAAAIYGAMKSAGLEPKGGFQGGKRVHRALSNEIAEIVKTSTAPTENIISLSRQLSDNILPELLKDAKKKGRTVDQALKPAAQQMAAFYEKAALMTPTGSSPAMVAKAIQQALGGSSEKSLGMYDFYRTNPQILAQMSKLGFFNLKTTSERINVLEKAFNTALPDHAIREMRESVTGGITAIKDTLFNQDVGILSFARGFDYSRNPEFRNILQKRIREDKLRLHGRERVGDIGFSKALETFFEEVDSPLKLIGYTLAPVLHGIGGLFAQAGPLMGHLASYWEFYMGPPLRALTLNLQRLTHDVDIGNISFAQAIGRMMAEFVKQIDLFLRDLGFFQVIGDFDEFRLAFIRGFDSLKYKINFASFAGKVEKVIKESFSWVFRKIAMALIAINLFQAVIAFAVQLFVQTMVQILFAMLGSLIKSLVAGLAWGTLASTFHFGVLWLGTVFLPITAAAAAAIAFIVRYRESIWANIKAIAQMVKGFTQIIVGGARIAVSGFFYPLGVFLDWVTLLLSKIPIVGKLWKRDKDETYQAFFNAQISGGWQDITEGFGNVGAGFRDSAKALAETTKAIISDVGAVGSAMVNAIGGKGDSTVQVSQNLATKTVVVGESFVNMNVETHVLAGATISTEGQARVLPGVMSTSYGAISRAIASLGPKIRSMSFMGSFTHGNYGNIPMDGNMMQKAEAMYKLLRSKGFSRYGAAALVGSMMQESGLNPGAVEPNGQGHGLLQWSFDRRDNLKRLYGNSWNTLANQLDYMFNHDTSRHQLGALRTASSRESAMAAEKAYIRYGIAGNRHAYMDQVLSQPWAKYKGHVQPKLNNIVKANHILKKASKKPLESTSSHTFNYDISDTSSHFNELGRLVAPGVISYLDYELSTAHLKRIGI